MDASRLEIWFRLERKPPRPIGTFKTHAQSSFHNCQLFFFFQVNPVHPQNHFNQDCVSIAWNISSICRCEHWLPIRQAQKQSHQKWITTNYSVLCSSPLIGLARLSSVLCAAERDRGGVLRFILWERANINYIYQNDQATLKIPFKLNIPKFALTITLSKKYELFYTIFSIWLVLFKVFKT